MSDSYYIFDHSNRQFIAFIRQEDLYKLLSQSESKNLYKVVKDYHALYLQDIEKEDLIYSIWKQTNRHPFAYWVEHSWKGYNTYHREYEGYKLYSHCPWIMDTFVHKTDLTNLIDYAYLLNSEIINKYPLPTSVTKSLHLIKLLGIN